MSQAQDIIDAIVSQIDAGLTAYKSVQGSFTQLTALDAEQLPIAMVFDPAATRDRDDDGEVSESISVAVVLVRDCGEGTTMRADVDTCVTQIETTPRLGDIVDFAWVGEYQVNETGARHVIGSLIVNTERQA